MSLNGIDPAAKSPNRVRRNWNRTIKGAVTGTLSVVQPIAQDAQGRLTLNVASSGGLTGAGVALSIKLDSTPGLVLSSGGLKILLDPTDPCLQLTTGLKVTVNAAGALSQTATGLQVMVDGTTLAISANALQINDGGVSLPKLGALTTKGDTLGFSTTHVRVPVGIDGQVLTADSVSAAGFKWATPSGGGGSSPLTTKGDVWVFSTLDTRLPVGIDGQVLTADSTQVTGLKWATPSGGGSDPLTTKGDIWVYSTTDDRLPVGANGQLLIADSTQTTGLNWVSTGTSANNIVQLDGSAKLPAVDGSQLTNLPSGSGVPYTGATSDLNMGSHSVIANTYKVGSTQIIASDHSMNLNGSDATAGSFTTNNWGAVIDSNGRWVGDSASDTQNGSVSGTSKARQPFAAGAVGLVIITLAALNGTTTHTFPVAFQSGYAILGDTAAVATVTSNSNSSISLNGTTTSGTIILLGR